jgi:hypothetical protein
VELRAVLRLQSAQFGLQPGAAGSHLIHADRVVARRVNFDDRRRFRRRTSLVRTIILAGIIVVEVILLVRQGSMEDTPVIPRGGSTNGSASGW